MVESITFLDIRFFYLPYNCLNTTVMLIIINNIKTVLYFLVNVYTKFGNLLILFLKC